MALLIAVHCTSAWRLTGIAAQRELTHSHLVVNRGKVFIIPGFEPVAFAELVKKEKISVRPCCSDTSWA
jgi:hypothetical protein